jgi:type I restriction enzyme, R subunit
LTVGAWSGGAIPFQIKLGPFARVAAYAQRPDENAQLDLKGKAKAFVRTYGFLATIPPYTGTGLSGGRSF